MLCYIRQINRVNSDSGCAVMTATLAFFVLQILLHVFQVLLLLFIYYMYSKCYCYFLLQHNTCPICRKTLGKPAATDAEETNVHETTDATDSSSSDSADSDASSQSSSNGDAVNSAVSGRLPAADGGKDDRIVDEPTASADVPDSTVQDVWPSGSTGLSLAEIHQMEQGRRPRSRSSSSSSSEYSSL